MICSFLLVSIGYFSCLNRLPFIRISPSFEAGVFCIVRAAQTPLHLFLFSIFFLWKAMSLFISFADGHSRLTIGKLNGGISRLCCKDQAPYGYCTVATVDAL